MEFPLAKLKMKLAQNRAMVDRELTQSFLLQLEEKLTLLKKTPIRSLADLQKDPILQNATLHSEDLLKRCQNMAGFRNILVHMYEKVNLSDVYAILKKHLEDFSTFASSIKTHLEKK